ncbi:phosphatase PAP2 family protein [Streptomyces clavuligerus]|nr:phosphatase PAP2 family protein [Streptomyces clavuligerus]ANW18521.1 phosphatidic acid phosphatase [Streptomyces clavuligerus]AXU13078.1 phosphatase PAP2 family protein [Streptomyces clavuligerus]MBY6303015.1 phosphatase PAP2 family protein [Streptomyces clavuligerus]QCS05861.1 phosphatase PAP2 family protein [Streptomyces clavuligerus]QPJ94773.1 phosphatase PAP2 family protein [Streptomyces clavuligerus]
MRYEEWAAADRELLALTVRGGAGLPGVTAAARGLSRAGEHGGLWLAAGLAGAAADRARRPAWLRATAVVGLAHVASVGVKYLVRRERPSGVEPAPARSGQRARTGAGAGTGSGQEAGQRSGTGGGQEFWQSSGTGSGQEAALARSGQRAGPGAGAGGTWPAAEVFGPYSFPSAHATSASAAAVAFGALLPAPLGAAALTSLAAAMCLSRLVVGVHYPTDIAAGAALGALAAHWGTRRPPGRRSGVGAGAGRGPA